MPSFVFDFGAVLFNWQPVPLLQKTIPQRATDAAAAQHWVAEFFQGFDGDWGHFDRGEIDVPTLVNRISTRTGLSRAEVQAVIDEVPHALTPLPDTVDLVQRLRQAGRPLYYLSNMPAPYADHLEREHAVVSWFDAGVFSARVKLGKPDPAIFSLAQQRFGRQPDELVFLDDNPHNIRAAQAAGWRALQFSTAQQAEADLRAAGWWPASVR